MRIVGIIPARYESSRFPGKPLADILGKTMIEHVYERSARASRLDRLVVATDDARIAGAVSGFGGEALLTRSDHPSGTDRLAEAARLMGLDDGDIVVNIQGDEPLVDPRMIEALVEALAHERECPMATLVFPGHSLRDYHNPNVVKVVSDSGARALYFSRSPIPFARDLTAGSFTFLKHLGFYAYSGSFLQTFTRLTPGRLEDLEKLEQLRALEHGYGIKIAISPVDTRGVDTPEDLARVIATLRGDG
jgi:3-deoxy-manno-octulosonate cytidylyltransferase (CMP-KDO synthetase)